MVTGLRVLATCLPQAAKLDWAVQYTELQLFEALHTDACLNQRTCTNAEATSSAYQCYVKYVGSSLE